MDVSGIVNFVLRRKAEPVCVAPASFWDRFTAELMRHNAHLLSVDRYRAHAVEFAASWGPWALVFYVVLGAYATAVIFNRQRFPGSPTVAFVLAELSAFFLTVLPLLMPFKGLRFLFGLVSFVMAMSLQTRLLAPRDDGEKGDQDTYLGHLFSTFGGNIRCKLKARRAAWPALSSVLRWLVLTVLLDTSMFLTNNWIPAHIASASGRYYCASLVTGLWVLFAMEWNYQHSAMLLETLGYTHTHTYMATNL